MSAAYQRCECYDYLLKFSQTNLFKFHWKQSFFDWYDIKIGSCLKLYAVDFEIE